MPTETTTMTDEKVLKKRMKKLAAAGKRNKAKQVKKQLIGLREATKSVALLKAAKAARAVTPPAPLATPVVK